MSQLTNFQTNVLKIAYKRYKYHIKNSAISPYITVSEINKICKTISNEIPLSLQPYLDCKIVGNDFGQILFGNEYCINEDGIALYEDITRTKRRAWFPVILSNSIAALALIVSIIALVKSFFFT